MARKEQLLMLAALFAPRRLLRPSDWAKENCILRDNISEMPGALHVFPYAREPLDAMADPGVNKVTLCWASQCSKTTTMYAGVGYLLAEFPKDSLWIMPSAENARRFSKNRWLPFVQDCKPLRAMCPLSSSGRVDSDKITNMVQEFIGATMTFAGAGSENNVKSAPVANLILDEIDEIDREIRLAALERVKGRREHKIIQTSTPVEETGGIWEEYNYGDQRRYFMACPHCGELIEFAWQYRDDKGLLKYSLQWDGDAKLDDGTWDFERVAETAHIVCPKCGGKITDADKIKMIENGEWIAQNPKAPPGHRSYHLNGLYSPITTFAIMATSWIQASQTAHGLKKFVQGWLAEPWREDWTNQDQSESHMLEGEHERGDIVGEYRILQVDTQTDHFRYVCRGYDKSGDSYLIDFGSVAGFADLDELFDRFQCQRGIIDAAGDRTQEIYEQVFKRRSKWFASRGWAKMQEPYRIQKKDPFTGDQKGRQAWSGKILYLHINNEVWEQEIEQLRSRKLRGFYTFKGTPKDYLDQLFGVYWTRETKKNGHRVTVRKVRRCGDHYFDCEKMGRALSKFLGIGRVDLQTPAEEPKKNRSARNRSATSFWD
jgi:phage terminase large subunit GpA-like protein